jgi:hypothetical protein
VYAHPQCYAARLGTCSRDISAEHYISLSVLKKLDKKTISILYSGELKTFTAKKFAFEVLCGNHNRALGELDQAAKRVVTIVLRFNRELEHPRPAEPHRVERASGWEFERWMLKAYCGLNSAGHIGAPWPMPDYIIDAVFNGTPLPMDLGLYMGGEVGDLVHVGKTIQLRPIRRRDTGEPCSLLFELCGVAFRLSLAPARDGGTGKVDGRDRHVPGIMMKDERSGAVRELEFDWS